MFHKPKTSLLLKYFPKNSFIFFFHSPKDFSLTRPNNKIECLRSSCGDRSKEASREKKKNVKNGEEEQLKASIQHAIQTNSINIITQLLFVSQHYPANQQIMSAISLCSEFGFG